MADYIPETPVTEEPKKNNKTLIIVLVVVGVVLLCCCLPIAVLAILQLTGTIDLFSYITPLATYALI
jgi:hypothetical protein